MYIFKLLRVVSFGSVWEVREASVCSHYDCCCGNKITTFPYLVGVKIAKNLKKLDTRTF